MGDFNSKLGLRRSDAAGMPEAFMGNFGKGTRNPNGEALASFLENTRMYATNTHFQHSMRHRSTWSGGLKNRTTGEINNYYNQIDYIMAPAKYKACVTDARAHNHMRFTSDHSLVVATFRFADINRYMSGSSRWERQRLPTTDKDNSDTQGQPAYERRTVPLAFRKHIAMLSRRDPPTASETAANQPTTPTSSPFESSIYAKMLPLRPTLTRIELPSVVRLERVQTALVAAAEECLEDRPKHFNGVPDYRNDPVLRQLSATRAAIHEKVVGETIKDPEERHILRHRRNQLGHGLRRRVMKLRERAIS
jgi:hypothetical protein